MSVRLSVADFGFQKLVAQIGRVLIQYLIKTDSRLVVGGGRGRIHRDNGGVTAHCRSPEMPAWN